ncbi:MAG: PCMD domain-containing protein [Chitinophagaceae bacterium]|nr:PCMD domain-containing protein [Chitinophagaceae bacterium]
MSRFLKMIFLCLLSLSGFSQTSLPNLDFESWVLSSSGRYEDPTPSTIWATPNYAMDLIFGNPSTSIVQKSTDAHGGSFAALMKSRTIVGNFVGATLFTGFLNTTIPLAPVPELGVPFIGRPIAMKGWYKYAPVNGDSSSIYVKLTKWNSTTNTRDVVGFIEKRDYAAVNGYTPFNLVINYSSSDVPDSITVVFSASAGAEQSVGQVGSSLWVDDVVFDYGANSLESSNKIPLLNCYPNPTNDFLFIQTTRMDLTYHIYTMTGQLVLNSRLPQISLSELQTGVYKLCAFDSKMQIVHQQSIYKF